MKREPVTIDVTPERIEHAREPKPVKSASRRALKEFRRNSQTLAEIGDIVTDERFLIGGAIVAAAYFLAKRGSR